ncbi:MAG: hypothetical protein UV60_C0001G0032 [Parcubacteria group bacterium GW2011_GWA2_43_11]|nr:MAG: hypothetical protein UU89_C0006G0033 [Parcubacteria group bacterium GW2011_GWC2_42_11]KKS86433.1 MAG: hypothetical protein UV60_C0001G0032 [Parcubacteria group bacterium GW2011_GWA2_43_11]
MGMSGNDKLFIVELFLKHAEEHFKTLLMYGGEELHIVRTVIESPLRDGSFVEAIVVTCVMSNSQSVKGKAFIITTSAPFKSDFVHITIEEDQKRLVEKMIPYGKMVLREFGDYVIQFLADFKKRKAIS